MTVLFVSVELDLEVKNLPKLKEEAKRTGGRLILYRGVYSLVFLTHGDWSVACVTPEQNRRLDGLIASIPTLLFGWWSPTGLIWTPCALAWNLRGGVDITETLTAEALGAHPKKTPIWTRKVDRFDNRSTLIGFAVFVTPFIGLIIYFIVTKGF